MNKKILLGLIASTLFVFATQAQQSRYGFRLGANYSDIDFEDDSFGIGLGSDSDARIGFVAGFFAQYYLSDKFSIQPELQYSAQGERSKVRDIVNVTNSGVATSDDRLTVNVLQLPIFLNFHYRKFTLSAGPQIGIRIWEFERRDDYETLQFSAIGGVGYDITDNFQINLRASYGITNAIEVDRTELRAEGQNHYLQLTLAYRL